MLYILLFSSKCSLFHNANLFGSCIIHIYIQNVLKLKKKNNSGAKGLISLVLPNQGYLHTESLFCSSPRLVSCNVTGVIINSCATYKCLIT